MYTHKPDAVSQYGFICSSLPSSPWVINFLIDAQEVDTCLNNLSELKKVDVVFTDKPNFNRIIEYLCANKYVAICVKACNNKGHETLHNRCTLPKCMLFNAFLFKERRRNSEHVKIEIGQSETVHNPLL